MTATAPTRSIPTTNNALTSYNGFVEIPAVNQQDIDVTCQTAKKAQVEWAKLAAIGLSRNIMVDHWAKV